jgi:hypothetical protein
MAHQTKGNRTKKKNPTDCTLSCPNKRASTQKKGMEWGILNTERKQFQVSTNIKKLK